MSAATLPSLLQSFFTERLLAQLRASEHTVASYRDCFRLLLTFTTRRLGKQPSALALEDLDAALKGAKAADGPAVICLKTNRDANLAIPGELGMRFAEVYQGPMG